MVLLLLRVKLWLLLSAICSILSLLILMLLLLLLNLVLWILWLLEHVLSICHMLLLCLELLLLVSCGSLINVRRLRLRLRHRRWLRCLDDYLIILVAMFVTNLLLVISTTPVPIYDVLVLILSRSKRVCQPVLVLSSWHPLHGHSLLPVAEGTDNEHFISTLPPSEDMLGWRWRSRWCRRWHLLDRRRHSCHVRVLTLHLLLLRLRSLLHPLVSRSSRLLHLCSLRTHVLASGGALMRHGGVCSLRLWAVVMGGVLGCSRYKALRA